ncbi:endonuclease domain-containing protein [Microbacterium sp. ASV49]|uniref:DUF559 domain-containing protein n=1 Tax=Microbacterium candidum TaxID=3041922 RepID=A0ABT7N371_9MICO|nr:DUF559 domain-containing protein [Microbacterium sp. ASV49]MDL9981154.1 DUF559 domain-containing protein [Microbacterium sp. ASV49]
MLRAVDSQPSRRIRELTAWVAGRNGVAHTSDVRATHFTAAEVARAVREERLFRIRRSWLVAPDCDPRRIAAASVGGRLTCISAAAVRGLWVPAVRDGSPGLIHVAVPGNSSRHDAEGIHRHWGTGPAPVARNSNDDHILNVLFHAAHCLARRDALAVWESAIRQRQIEAGVLRGIAWRSAAAASLATVASALSESGLETYFVDGMRNAGVLVRQQVWIDGHPLDGLIADSLAIQLDGFAHHSSPVDRRRDIAADARLTNLGYVVLRFDYYQVLFEWPVVLETVLTAIARGAHRRAVLPHR